MKSPWPVESAATCEVRNYYTGLFQQAYFTGQHFAFKRRAPVSRPFPPTKDRWRQPCGSQIPVKIPRLPNYDPVRPCPAIVPVKYSKPPGCFALQRAHAVTDPITQKFQVFGFYVTADAMIIPFGFGITKIGWSRIECQVWRKMFKARQRTP